MIFSVAAGTLALPFRSVVSEYRRQNLMEINWLMWADFLSVLLVMVIFRVFLKFCRLPTEQVALEIFLRCGEYLPENFGISEYP